MLKKRIQILEEGNIITGVVATFVNAVIDMMNQEIGNADIARAEMFTTHLAMATQRICNGQLAEELDNDTWDEIVKLEHYERAEDFYKKMMKESPVECPESEKRYILLHLCNLLEN